MSQVCERVERVALHRLLDDVIDDGLHTIVMAPSRFGATTLLERFCGSVRNLQQAVLPVYIDLQVLSRNPEHHHNVVITSALQESVLPILNAVPLDKRHRLLESNATIEAILLRARTANYRLILVLDHVDAVRSYHLRQELEADLLTWLISGKYPITYLMAAHRGLVELFPKDGGPRSDLADRVDNVVWLPTLLLQDVEGLLSENRRSTASAVHAVSGGYPGLTKTVLEISAALDEGREHAEVLADAVLRKAGPELARLASELPADLIAPLKAIALDLGARSSDLGGSEATLFQMGLLHRDGNQYRIASLALGRHLNPHHVLQPDGEAAALQPWPQPTIGPTIRGEGKLSEPLVRWLRSVVPEAHVLTVTKLVTERDRLYLELLAEGRLEEPLGWRCVICGSFSDLYKERERYRSYRGITSLVAYGDPFPIDERGELWGMVGHAPVFGSKQQSIVSLHEALRSKDLSAERFGELMTGLLGTLHRRSSRTGPSVPGAYYALKNDVYERLDKSARSLLESTAALDPFTAREFTRASGRICPSDLGAYLRNTLLTDERNLTISEINSRFDVDRVLFRATELVMSEARWLGAGHCFSDLARAEVELKLKVFPPDGQVLHELAKEYITIHVLTQGHPSTISHTLGSWKSLSGEELLRTQCVENLRRIAFETHPGPDASQEYALALLMETVKFLADETPCHTALIVAWYSALLLANELEDRMSLDVPFYVQMGLDAQGTILDQARLETQIYAGESSLVEWKCQCLDGDQKEGNDALAREIAAFANTRGGVLVVGLADKNEEHDLRLAERTRAMLADATNEGRSRMLHKLGDLAEGKCKPGLERYRLHVIQTSLGDHLLVMVIFPGVFDSAGQRRMVSVQHDKDRLIPYVRVSREKLPLQSPSQILWWERVHGTVMW